MDLSLILTPEILIFLGSFFIGFFGSGAYILAVKIGFAGGNNEKERNFTYKRFNKNVKNCFCYMFFGGFFAGVLQIVTPTTFVPFQSLITGITWPSVVSGLLSGKQAEPNKEDLSPAIPEDSNKKAQMEILQNTLDNLTLIKTEPQKILKDKKINNKEEKMKK
jgi:hypothetical protein